MVFTWANDRVICMWTTFQSLGLFNSLQLCKVEITKSSLENIAIQFYILSKHKEKNGNLVTKFDIFTKCKIEMIKVVYRNAKKRTANMISQLSVEWCRFTFSVILLVYFHFHTCRNRYLIWSCLICEQMIHLAFKLNL